MNRCPEFLRSAPFGVALLFVVIVGPLAASEPTEMDPVTQEAADEVSAETPDVEAFRTAVEAADRNLDQAARERDRETFQGLLATDTVFLAGELHRGRLEVLAIWQHLFDGKYDFRYEGETLDVVVAASGDLAWTVGAARTRFTRPGLTEPEVIDGHYLHLWKPDDEGAWRLVYNASLVVHPTLGSARDPRSGLMTAWPELADQVGARIDLVWNPLDHVVASSGEVAYTFGEYSATFGPPSPLTPPAESDSASESSDDAEATTEPPSEPIAGTGNYLAVWQKDEQGRWQLAGEGFTPPGIYSGR